MIFKKHKNLINNFLEYDYVGAPWLQCKQVGNGGLSLRKKSVMLKIMNTIPYNGCNEDVYFSRSMNINKPSYTKALQFSVETIFNNISFGCHSPWKYENYDNLLNLYEDFNELCLLNDYNR